MNINELSKKVNTVKNEVETILLGRKGKTNAKKVTEQIIEENGLKYSKAIRESFTHYYIMSDDFHGSISLFISYDSQGKVVEVKTY